MDSDTCTIKGLGYHLYSGDTLKDFKILVEGSEIPVHRCILGAKSPIFDRMLTTDMIEGRLGQMSITDFKFKTVLEAITFFYMGEISIENRTNSSILAELLHFANKYDIQELMTYCLWVIEKNKNKFSKDETRLMICTAVETSCEKILDKILDIFETKEFVTIKPNYSMMDMKLDEPPAQEQDGYLAPSPSLESLESLFNFSAQPYEYDYSAEASFWSL